MRRIIFKLLSSILILFFLYQENSYVRFILPWIFLWTYGFRISLQASEREKMLFVLINKILLASSLIILSDLKVLHVGVVAWIVGVKFLLSGVDMIAKSFDMHSGMSNLPDRRNIFEAILLFVALLGFSLQSCLSQNIYHFIQIGVSVVWIFFTVFLMIHCLRSDEFRILLKES